jgi:predicted Rossmann-fold nucleotide-binding protein
VTHPARHIPENIGDEGPRAVRVLVCGGRDYRDAATFTHAMRRVDETFGPFRTVISGGARGADAYAHAWAVENERRSYVFPAQWGIHGKRAGPIRNAEMLRVGKPDLVVAFPGGRGTADMAKQAEAAGVPVVRIGGP